MRRRQRPLWTDEPEDDVRGDAERDNDSDDEEPQDGDDEEAEAE